MVLFVDWTNSHPFFWAVIFLDFEDFFSPVAVSHFFFPLRPHQKHIINDGHKRCDISIHNVELFESLTSFLQLTSKSGELLAQRFTKSVQDFFVNLHILLVHFLLHVVVGDKHAAETAEILVGGNGFLGGKDLSQQLVPLADVIMSLLVFQSLEDFFQLDVPKTL